MLWQKSSKTLDILHCPFDFDHVWTKGYDIYIRGDNFLHPIVVWRPQGSRNTQLRDYEFEILWQFLRLGHGMMGGRVECPEKRGASHNSSSGRGQDWSSGDDFDICHTDFFRCVGLWGPQRPRKVNFKVLLKKFWGVGFWRLVFWWFWWVFGTPRGCNIHESHPELKTD